MPRGERTADGVFPAGALIAGKYRIERMVGQGGMGTVYAAQHETLRQRVALKVLRDQAMVEATTVERFLNEARAASRIQNEHVARVMDAGQTDDGLPYIVLEFLEGADLAEVLRQRGRLAVTDAVDYVLQALEALAEAHALGIVHRPASFMRPI